MVRARLELPADDHAPHGWGRLGAFVDGVYAIAATLLVIELRPPEDARPGELGYELLHMGPEYWAYAIGFLQMIAGWLQTRRLDAWMRGIDHYATLLVLLSVGVYALTPFSTAVLATRSAATTTSAPRCGCSRCCCSSRWSSSWPCCWLLPLAGLLRDDVAPDARQLYLRNSLLVPVVPVIAFVLSYDFPWVGLVLLVGLNVLGLLPLESHQPPAGVDRGPLSTSRRRRSARREQQHQVDGGRGGAPPHRRRE